MEENTRMSFSLGYSTVIYILFYRRNHCFSPLSPFTSHKPGRWPSWLVTWLLRFREIPGTFFFFLTDSTLHLSANRLFGILWASVKRIVLIHVLSHDIDIVKAVSSLMKKIQSLVVLWIFQNKIALRGNFIRQKCNSM